MEKLGLNEIRRMFRDFFVEKGHYPEKSASLIPKNDKSLLIINSGMAPLKPYFSGYETPPAKRMTTCQKCVRTGDIENVGKTARHGTFFEMLGNFSFGDYFKKESLTWGWEFITKYLKMHEDKLWATIYEDDEEAHDIWISLGMPEEKIVRLGKDDNFWEIGLGPCGPCSEIYYDRGEEYGCDDPECKPGCDCDRYIEFWNHVFTQFSKEEDGSYSDLEHPNIDTGMGLERIACIMQGVDSIFDVDTVKHILDAVADMSGKEYKGGTDKNDVSMRIITDHIRSTVFMVSDGILPSNEGRGYILRRLIRRAARHGKLLGIEDEVFLSKLADKVVEVSGEAYPELVEKQAYIKKIIAIEEEKFAKAIDQGLDILKDYVDEAKAQSLDTLSGEKAFKLYDTYGFPVEVTEEILAEEGLSVDMEGFADHMKKQKEMARKGRKSTEEEAWKDAAEYADLPPTEFLGYSVYSLASSVQYVGDYDKDHQMIITECTPFYATSGGQNHDIGKISFNGESMDVVDVVKENGIFLHVIAASDSEKTAALKEGDEVELEIDSIVRNRSARNHSAAHLLDKSLRVVLGDHVMQAGSYLDDKYLRFDFTHYEAMTKEQIAEVERLVNEAVDKFLPITVKEMPIEEGKALGAIAAFDEKYGDMVRVVDMGGFSIEFCGGTHLDNTGKVGYFKIMSESGIASGVRRIEAVTGTNIAPYLHEKEHLVAEAAEVLKTGPKDIVSKASQVVNENKELEKEIKALKVQEISGQVDDIMKGAEDLSGVSFISKRFDGADIDQLRSLCDSIKGKTKETVMVFASVNDDKVIFIAAVTDDLIGSGYHAGNIVKEAAKVAGGGGGGKPGMAQAGGRFPEKIEEAFAVAGKMVKEN